MGFILKKMIIKIIFFLIFFSKSVFSEEFFEINTKDVFSFSNFFLVNKNNDFILDTSKIENDLSLPNLNIDLDDHNSIDLICELNSPTTFFFEINEDSNKIFFKNNEKFIINEIYNSYDPLPEEQFYNYLLFNAHPQKNTYFIKKNLLYVFVYDFKKLNLSNYSSNLDFKDIFPSPISDCKKIISYENNSKFFKFLEVHGKYKPLSPNYSNKLNYFNNLKSPINLKYFKCSIIQKFNLSYSFKFSTNNDCYIQVNSFVFFIYNFIFNDYFKKQNNLYVRNLDLSITYIFLITIIWIIFLYVLRDPIKRSSIYVYINVIKKTYPALDLYSILNLTNINKYNYIKKIFYYFGIIIFLAICYAIKFYIFLDAVIIIFLIFIVYNTFKKIR